MFKTIMIFTVAAATAGALAGQAAAASPAYCDAIANVAGTVMDLKQSGQSYDETVDTMTANFGADPSTLKIAIGIVDEAYKDSYPVRADDAGRKLVTDGFRSALRDMCLGG